MPKLPLRRSCRALLVEGHRVLLAEHRTAGGGAVWVGPGGGVEHDESLLDALTRELHEETGLLISEEHAPLLIWIQTAHLHEMTERGYSGVSNHYFFIRVEVFEPASGVAPGAAGHPEDEGILSQRWWHIDEIEEAHTRSSILTARSTSATASRAGRRSTDKPPHAQLLTQPTALDCRLIRAAE